MVRTLPPLLRTIFAVLALSTVGRGVARATEALPRVEVDRLVQPLIDGRQCQSIVVGLIGPDGETVMGYGRTTTAEAGKTPDGRTVYEIGSVSKAFTGILLADMVIRGDVSLDDPVQKFLPDTVKLAAPGDHPITLGLLSTQRSGLPRMPDNFEPRDPANPYADYTPERMYAFLNRWKPVRDPGAEYEYSNLGVGLLGHALARKAKMSYEALVTERLLKPLQMNDTTIVFREDQRARLAPGHGADGRVVANWDIPTFAGAGGLRSTGNDMMRFLRANLALDEVAPAKAIAMSHQVRGKASGDNDIGLGWHVNRKSHFVWHNGQTAGYHCFIAFEPSKKVGVVLLTNTGAGAVDGVGDALLTRLAGNPAGPPKR